MTRNPFKVPRVIVDKTFGNGVRRFCLVSDMGDGVVAYRAEWWTVDMFETLDEALKRWPGTPVMTAADFEAKTGEVSE